MSLKIEGKQCQFCKSYLFEEDDVVFCPECGAPYHRECYNKVGDCALAHLHGTPEQYSEDAAVKDEDIEPKETANGYTKCKMCGKDYDEEEPKCPECGTPNLSKAGGNYVVFDFLGGVAPETDLGEGVTAEEAKKFVFSNTQRYIPKFSDMRLGKKVSWNWLAFIFPGPWMLSRKMYGLGSLFCALSLIADLFRVGLNSVLFENMEYFSYANMQNFLMEGLTAVDIPIFVLGFLGVAIFVAIHVLGGIFGDYIYRNHTLSSVKKLKEEEINNQNEDVLWHKKGGVSLLAMIIGIFVVGYLPQIIGSFLL